MRRPQRAALIALFSLVPMILVRSAAAEDAPVGATTQTVAFTHLPAGYANTEVVDLVAAQTDAPGLVVALATSGPCELTNGLLTYSQAGLCTITASQRGDATYAPAVPISTTVVVSAAAPYAKPSLTITSVHGTVTMVARVDLRDAGKKVSFFVRSGLSGQVRSVGLATTNALGVATAVTTSKVGGHLRIYAKVLGVSGDRAYSHDVALTVG